MFQASACRHAVTKERKTSRIIKIKILRRYLYGKELAYSYELYLSSNAFPDFTISFIFEHITRFNYTL